MIDVRDLTAFVLCQAKVPILSHNRRRKAIGTGNRPTFVGFHQNFNFHSVATLIKGSKKYGLDEFSLNLNQPL